LLPAPTAPSTDMPVFVTRSAEASPSLDPGSPAQASLPIRPLPPREELNRSTRLRHPRVRWSVDPSSLPRTEVLGQSRPMFCGPSWVDHSCVPLCSRHSEERFEPRRARGRSTLPAPLPGWPRVRSRKSLCIACRRRSDLWSPAAPFLPLPAFRGGRDRRPDHPSTMHPSPESGKRKMRA